VKTSNRSEKLHWLPWLVLGFFIAEPAAAQAPGPGAAEPPREPPASPSSEPAFTTPPAAPPSATAPGPAPYPGPPAAAPAHAPGGYAPGGYAPGGYAPGGYAPGGYRAPAYAPRTLSQDKPPDSRRIGNANADHVVLLPTAYTHPEGTLYLSSHELVILQLGYALSDSTQVTLTGLPPITEGEDTVYFFDLSLKNAFVRSGPLRLAGIGSVTGVVGIEQGNLVLGRAGAVAELCFDRACDSSASLSSNVMLAGPGTVMFNGAGVIFRAARWAALLLEVETVVPLGAEVGEFSGVAVAPGLRFPYRTWALDVSAIRPLDAEDPTVEWLPWLSFTYRFLP